MTYDPRYPKPSSFFYPSARRNGPSVTRLPVALKLFWQSPNYFYGTDQNGEKDSFRSSITWGMKERLVAPILEFKKNPKGYFFSPYNDCYSAVGLFLAGPLMAATVLGSLPAVPLIALTIMCYPAVVELFFGITSVVQALWHTSMALLPRTREEELNKAHEYFLDAATRLSLVAPLALLCAVAVPFEAVRFFTRLVSSCMAKPASHPARGAGVYFIPVAPENDPRFPDQGLSLARRQREVGDPATNQGYTIAELPGGDNPTTVMGY